MQDIAEGEEITMQHVSSVLGNHKRRRRIMSDFYVDCACAVRGVPPFPGITRRNFSNAICALQRCADPTECGTFVSGVTCEACEVGTMLPIDSLDVYSGKLLS